MWTTTGTRWLATTTTCMPLSSVKVSGLNTAAVADRQGSDRTTNATVSKNIWKRRRCTGFNGILNTPQIRPWVFLWHSGAIDMGS